MRHTQAMRMFPFWWLRQSPYFTRWTGDEGIGIPSEVFGMFVPVERWVMDSDAKTLAAYMLSAPLGLADSYWLEALVLAIEAKAYDLWVNVRDTPFSLDIVAEDEIVALPDMTVVQGSNICFSAAHTLTVGGNSINFTVEAGASVRLEAANTIRMLEGTTIQGYLLARIVTGDTFCYPEPMMLAADQGENFPLFTESSESNAPAEHHNRFNILVYPNPTEGNFTLELFDMSSSEGLYIQVFNLLGKKLKSAELPAENLHQLTLPSTRSGVYLS